MSENNVLIDNILEKENADLKDKLKKMTIKAVDVQRVLVETRALLKKTQDEKAEMKIEIDKLNSWKIWD